MITDHGNHKTLYNEFLFSIFDMVLCKSSIQIVLLYTSALCRYLRVYIVCFFRLKKSEIGLHHFCSKMDRELANESQMSDFTSSWKGMLNTALQEICFKS